MLIITAVFVERVMSEMRPYIGAERRLVKLIEDKQKPMKNAEAPMLAKYKFRVGMITAVKILAVVIMLEFSEGHLAQIFLKNVLCKYRCLVP